MASVDNIWAIVVFFGLSIFFITILMFWNVAKGLTTDFWDLSSVGDKIKDNGQRAVDQFDFILIMAYMGLHLGILAFAYFLRTHPVVYIAAIILIAVLALIAAPISNAYQDLQTNSETSMVTAMDEIPMTNNIMENLPKYEIIWGFITVIVMFGLARTEGFI